jgi:hypothetical protein
VADDMDWENFVNQSQGYEYNHLDKVRRSHDVRIFDDGEVRLLKPDSDEEVGSDAVDPEAPPDTDPNAGEDGGEADERSCVDIRRTDIMRVRRGTGFHSLQTYYHIGWPNDGKDFPESRDKEFKTIKWTINAGTEDEKHCEVKIPLIKTMKITSNTGSIIHPFGDPVQGQWIDKRFVFDNGGGGDGRDFTIKDVGEKVKVEVIKKMIVRAASGHTFIESRFWSGIWADPDANPDLYQEDAKRDTSGDAGAGGDGGGE